MFYCEKCAEKKGWPQTIFKSVGRCEVCRAQAACNETPSSMLPDPKSAEEGN